MKCNSVIFDFNGSLFFDNDKHVLAWGKISQELRDRELTQTELHEHCNGVPNNEVITFMLESAGKEIPPIEEIEEISRRKEAYYRGFCAADQPSFHLVKGAEELFDSLKEQGIPFTIASASIKENIDFFVESFRLDRWIRPEDIVYDDGTYSDKVAMFQDAARVLGQKDLSGTIIVEDSRAGITNGYKAGSEQIIVINSANNREEFSALPGVVCVVEDFSELEPVEKA